MIRFHSVGILSSRVVTLGSIEIFDTHEWFGSKPNVYFQCRGENRTFLPDVKQSHLQYTFKGEESWQVCNHGIVYNIFVVRLCF